MSENTVERAGYTNIVTVQANAAILKGGAVKIIGDRIVGNAAAADINIGVALAAASASGVMIPVCFGGPILRVMSWDTIAAGEAVSARATTGNGYWYTGQTSAKSAGVALTASASGVLFDVVFCPNLN